MGFGYGQVTDTFGVNVNDKKIKPQFTVVDIGIKYGWSVNIFDVVGAGKLLSKFKK
ncbi:hypothetical protein VKI22_16430 [Cyanobacterium aponinum UTEX 3221]|uniref:hypothetical protein n=1 Tax=Cyanobacterium aponinum TaxID=379064 RepID=UPI002B4BC73F|nr:hypothetical protein [Cyanobacterium aponinum]WRL38186.1 hypothetical protein VKI22_16430 [Cyanobacterium aponinum UTEX 3221]